MRLLQANWCWEVKVWQETMNMANDTISSLQLSMMRIRTMGTTHLYDMLTLVIPYNLTTGFLEL